MIQFLLLLVQEGFEYHHGKPDYIMLNHWIPETVNTLPQDASHRVGIGAFVVNSNREVYVLQLNLISLVH